MGFVDWVMATVIALCVGLLLKAIPLVSGTRKPFGGVAPKVVGVIGKVKPF